MRTFAAIWSVIFAVFFVLQLNDPDPLWWMLIYGAAASISLFFALNRPRRFEAVVVAAVALGWALQLIPGFIGKVGPGDMFLSMKAERPEIEEERETGGLFIVAGVLGYLAFARRGNAKLASALAAAKQKK